MAVAQNTTAGLVRSLYITRKGEPRSPFRQAPSHSRLCRIVPFVSYLIFVTVSILEIAVLWRLVQNSSWRRYPGLACYVTYDLVSAFTLLAVLRSTPALYPSLYWKSEILRLILGFLVFWDIFRHAFPQRSGLREAIFKRLAVVGLMPIILSSFLWAVACYRRFHYLSRALEHSLGFFLASLILMILTAVKYYQVPLGRNAWGIALGLGIYTSLSTVIFGITDLTKLFVPYMQILRPLSFVATLGLWAWAVWIYAPNRVSSWRLATAQATAWTSWSDGWKQAISLVRRVIWQ